MRDTENACARAEISFVSADFARDHRDASAWILVLTLGFEHEEGEKPPGQELIGELGFDEELPALESPLWCESGRPGHMFFWLHAFAPNAIDEDRATLHPWVDHIFRREAARQVLDEHLRGELNVLSVGTGGLTLIRRGADPAPLFVMPQTDDLAWGLGLFPSAHPFFQKHVLPRMSEYAEYGCAAGGKRYPAGFLELSNTDQWADHYGAIWPLFQQAKRRFDPKHLLNPGFMEWQ
jgi:hypothetical protein